MGSGFGRQWFGMIAIFVAWAFMAPCVRGGDDTPAPDSPLVKLLKSGRVPEARQGAILEMIGKRGTVADLDFLYERAVAPARLPAAMRVKALEALAEAALTRDLRPAGHHEALVPLLKDISAGPDRPLANAVIRLAGLWKLGAAAGTLGEIARAQPTDDATRSLALGALAEIGAPEGKSQIEMLTAGKEPVAIRAPAVAALARLDIEQAAALAVELIPAATAQGRDLAPLVAAFLNRQGGADSLAAAITRQPIPADAAKLVLRNVYAQGHADPSLVTALSRAAGLSADVKPLTPAELSSLVAEVAAHGDPERGELIFRRADLNCMSCHAVCKAGGDVGPDLSSVGSTSPSDYIINSILNPDQSIKEQYHTLLVQTDDGQVFQGIVADRDNQRIILKDATGAPRVVPVASIEDQKPGGSLMPKGLVNLMTHTEFVDLVRFLSELGKPGPYAIRSTPTIQRWRVLKPAPTSPSAPPPLSADVPGELKKFGPDAWTSAYAKVSGALPLNDPALPPGVTSLILQGQLSVTTGGPIQVKLDSAQGVRYWVDDQAAPAGSSEFTPQLEPGGHTITLEIDPISRPAREIKVELRKPSGSSAEFSVVGGR